MRDATHEAAPRDGSTALGLAVAAAIEARLGELAQEWWRTTRSGGERDGGRRPVADAGRAESLVESVIGALRGQPMWHDSVMRAGWLFGCDAHRQRVPLHFVLEELDALATMLFTAAAEACGPTGASASEGLVVARRLLSGFATVRLAATKGYTQSVVDELRKHYRQVRHGLRNPLGTIKSALALMDDETMPEETRRSGRFKQMAERNAKSLDTLIAQELGDQAALLPAFAHEPVSLRTIACGVRRDLRAEAMERQVEIIIGDSMPTVQIDSAGLELILKSALLALLRELAGPAEIVIELSHLSGQSALVTLVVSPEAALARPVDIGALSFARELATATGGQLWVDSRRRLCVEVPISAREPAEEVRRPRQGADLESRAL